MAKKRMFRLDVLETDAFMDMPLTTQALYFHLNLRADDDGFVGNPKRIVHSIGANLDDLNLLIAKRFVLTFEDGVIVIKHWRLHNNLTSFRYQETQYIEDKSMLRIKDNNAYSFDHGEYLDDAHYIEVGKRQTKDETKTRQRRDKDELEEKSIDKKSIYIEVSKDTSSSHNNVERVLSEWNKLPEPIKKVRGLKPSTERYKMLTSRIKEYGIDSVIEAVHKVGASDFLRRGSDKGWQIDFEWFVRPNNFPKVLDGKYDNKNKATASYYSKPKNEWDSYMWGAAIKDGYVTQDDYREWRESNGTI